MGYVVETIKLVSDILDTNPDLYSMLELGNQYIFPNGNTEVNNFNLNPYPGGNVAKSYFTQRYSSLLHTSVDYNGQDGALKIDLSAPNALRHLGLYDVITNLGTLEHVGEGHTDESLILKAQYEAFKNVHDSLSVDGVWFNLGPHVGSWPGHCPCYYTIPFFEELLSKNGYTEIRSPEKYTYSDPNTELFVLFIAHKIKDVEFMSLVEFKLLRGFMEIVL